MRPSRGVECRAMSSPDPRTSVARPTGWLALLLLALVALTHGPALSGDFVYDDELLFGPSNEATASLGAALRHALDPLWSFDRPTPIGDAGDTLERAFWRPLTVLALAVGRALPGDGAFGPHLVSLALHALATLLAWRLAARLLQGNVPGALVAALFAVHPVQAEPVAWAAAVNDPLAGALVLGALLAHARWGAREGGPRGAPLLGGLCALLALLAKEQALVLPLFIVALELVQGRRPAARALAPYIAALAVWYLTRAWIFRDVFAGLLQRQGDFGFTPAREASFRVELLGGFLRLLAWPVDLAVFRPVRPVSPSGDTSALQGALWLAAFGAAAAAALWRRARVAAFGLALTIAAPVLVAGALHTAGRYPLSDRYLYVSVFGFALVVVGAAWRHLPRAAALGLAALVVVAGALGTRAHAAVFASPAAFHAHAVGTAPRDPYVQVLAGRAELQRYKDTLDQERLLVAYLHFLRSLTLGTDYGEKQVDDDPALPLRQRIARLERMMLADTKYRRQDPTVFWTPYERLEANLGQLYVHLYTADSTLLDDFQAPLDIAEQLVTLFEHEARVWTAKGQVHQKRRELEEAERCYRVALERDRRDTLAWKQLAAVLTELGRDGDARRAYEEALRRVPGDLSLRAGALASALREKQLAVAESHLDQYIAAAPGTREAAYWRGRVSFARGHHREALDALDRALALDAGWGEAMKHKGLVQHALGDTLGALETLAAAARALPDDFEVHYQLAALMGLVVPPDQEDPRRREQRIDVMVRAYDLSPPNEYRLHLQNALVDLVGGDPNRTFTLATRSEKRRDEFSARFWYDRTVAAAGAWPEQERQANLAEALTRLGSLMRQNADEQVEAIGVLSRAVELAPTSFDAHFELATTYKTAKRHVEAGTWATRALDLMRPEEIAPDMRDAVRATLESWAREGDAANAVGPTAPPGDGK